MDTREEIYEKAVELFIANGYDQTPVSKIAKSLGITKAALYYYFKSKEELLFFIYQRNMETDLIPIIESAEEIDDPEKRISYLIRSYTRSGMARKPSEKMIIHEMGNLTPEHQEIINRSWRRFFDLIRDTIAEMGASEKCKKINNIFAAFALMGMFRWTFNWFDPARTEAAEDLIDTYNEIFFRGILKY